MASTLHQAKISTAEKSIFRTTTVSLNIGNSPELTCFLSLTIDSLFFAPQYQVQVVGRSNKGITPYPPLPD